MSRRPFISIVAIAAISFCATIAFAEGEPSVAKWGGSVYLFGHDAPITLGGAPEKLGVIGLGYEMVGALGKDGHCGWAIGGEYGVGNIKEEITPTGGSTTTTEYSATHWGVRAGIDYWHDCCEKKWYCGSGLKYMSTSVTAKQTGSTDFDFEPYKVYGIDSRLGGDIRISPKLGLFGSTSFLIGRASFEQTFTGFGTEKLTSWTTMSSWRGGLRLDY